MKNVRYLIIDDEPLAHKNIENYASEFAWLSKVGNCYDALEAIHFLRKENVDLIFLDIEMPKLTGLEFLDSLSSPPKIIITSAYSQYAIDGYEYQVLDYLLKPFSLQRFSKALFKLPFDDISSKKSSGKILNIKENGIVHKVDSDNILYMEAYGNYVKIYLKEGKLLSLKSLTRYEGMLREASFIRIHKSYLINIACVQSFSSQSVFIQGIEVPIGKLYKKSVLEQLKEA